MAYKYPVHKHPVHDTDTHFIIDPISRLAVNAELKKTYLIQYDHNSERFSFELPRYIEEHDMSLCDKVEVHYTNTDSSTRKQNAGVYEVDDLMVCADCEDKVALTWLVSENATMYSGSLSFVVQFSCTEGEEVAYRWHTAPCNTVSIGPGMNNSDAIIEEYPDILVQWKLDLFSRNYSYEGAVANGFEGTEEEWYEYIIEWAKNTLYWDLKQNKLNWVSEADIDAMFDGTYEGVEDETADGYSPTFVVDDETLIINNGGDE